MSVFGEQFFSIANFYLFWSKLGFINSLDPDPNSAKCLDRITESGSEPLDQVTYFQFRFALLERFGSGLNLTYPIKLRKTSTVSVRYRIENTYSRHGMLPYIGG